MVGETTESLRETLFDAINKVKVGSMNTDEARIIAILADKIIKSAALEIQYSIAVSSLDKDGQGIEPGKLLLTDGTKS